MVEEGMGTASEVHDDADARTADLVAGRFLSRF